MEQLRAELRAQFRRQSPVPSPPKEQAQPARSPERPNMDDMVRAVTAQVGLMLDARRRQAAQAASQAPATKTTVGGPKSPSTSTPRRGPPNLTEEPQKGSKTKGKGKGKKIVAPTAAKATTNPSSPSTSAPPPQPSVPASVNEGWNVVTRGKKKATAKSRLTSKPAPQRQKATKPKPRKLRPPRSAAVVLTLHPDAEGKGVTYAQVLSRAKENIDLEQLGITAIKFKRAATGARVLELPGAANGEKADSLAKELAEKLGEDIVRVSRPVKCAELRLTELDDSVSPGEVVAAVAKVGGCAEDQIKAGEIRQDASGLGTIWLRCPITAAKKVVEADRGRIRVGWVRAAVKLLDQRPMRCYKCLEKGHNTCVRQRAAPLWISHSPASPWRAVSKVGRVMVGVETLSDHRYIRFDVATPSLTPDNLGRIGPVGGGPRWALTKLDRELLKEAAIIQAWLPVQEEAVAVEEEASWLREAMTPFVTRRCPGPSPYRQEHQCTGGPPSSRRCARAA
ncbi:uncharacterized protein LOC133534384 [Cydia pomonella]|uniref:uncharacterized protein LOC133534384 n=1 Tax=Cydia pomonella TaxID=82600 RepID=UPI002ADE28D8|nr:uncharacterized protein LOC133534384 [Cydia pomonella]